MEMIAALDFVGVLVVSVFGGSPLGVGARGAGSEGVGESSREIREIW